MALEVLCKCLCPAESLIHRGQTETQIKTMGLGISYSFSFFTQLLPKVFFCFLELKLSKLYETCLLEDSFVQNLDMQKKEIRQICLVQDDTVKTAFQNKSNSHKCFPSTPCFGVNVG